jgi:hypothetical protein
MILDDLGFVGFEAFLIVTGSADMLKKIWSLYGSIYLFQWFLPITKKQHDIARHRPTWCKFVGYFKTIQCIICCFHIPEMYIEGGRSGDLYYIQWATIIIMPMMWLYHMWLNRRCLWFLSSSTFGFKGDRPSRILWSQEKRRVGGRKFGSTATYCDQVGKICYTFWGRLVLDHEWQEQSAVDTWFEFQIDYPLAAPRNLHHWQHRVTFTIVSFLCLVFFRMLCGRLQKFRCGAAAPCWQLDANASNWRLVQRVAGMITLWNGMRNSFNFALTNFEGN